MLLHLLRLSRAVGEASSGKLSGKLSIYLVLLETPKYKLLTNNAAKKIQNETAPITPQSKITVSNFHINGAMFVFKQRK